MRWFFALILILFAPFAALAQQDDSSRLESYLQEKLSDAGRTVTISGFEGALSSTATIRELTIADSAGVWLTLRGVQLDWSRAALLSGRIEVNTLTAREILLPRLPAKQSALQKSQSGSFELPDLPVSVQIGAFGTPKLVIGVPVLGQAAQMAVTGAVSLAGGQGTASLSAQRIDGRTDRVDLSAGFDNETRQLTLDLSLEEQAGGIASTALRLPGQPALGLSITGDAPLSDFAATIKLSSDGQPRFGGTVTVQDQLTPDQTPAGRSFAADLQGDIAPLFAPEYQPFFGGQMRLYFSGKREKDGGISLSEFGLNAAEISVSGSLDLLPSGLPARFDLSGQIAANGPVILPLPGPTLQLGATQFSAGFDAAAGQEWRANLTANQVWRGDLRIGQLTAGGSGRITDGKAPNVTAQLRASATAMTHQAKAWAAALGTDLSGTGDLIWHSGDGVEVQALRITGAGLDLTAKGSVTGALEDMTLSGELGLISDDISRFSGLVNRPISGAAMVALTGRYALLSGGFDAAVKASTNDLVLGIAQLDPYLRGAADLSLTAARDASGTRIDRLSIDSDTAQIAASGQLSKADAQAQVQARLSTIAPLAQGLNGPGQVQAAAHWQQGGPVVLDQFDITAAGGQASGGGRFEPVTGDLPQVDLWLRGTAPLGLANTFIAPRDLQGMANFDLRMVGRPGLAALSGQALATDARLSAPTLGEAVTGLNIGLTLADGQAQVAASGAVSSGGSLVLSGPVGLSKPFEADLGLTLTNVIAQDPSLYRTRLNGDLAIRGPLTGGAVISGALALDQAELRVPSGAIATSGVIPDGLRHVNDSAAVRATRVRAGLEGTKAGRGGGVIYGLDLALEAPNQIFVRGRGLDAELGGQLRLSGTTADVMPIGRFDLVRGRLDILGQRLSLTEGLIRLQGAFDPYVRLVAETKAADGTAIQIVTQGPVSAPEIEFTSTPQLPQDEVLARLLFGRSITTLSAFQAAQMASAVAVLTGRSDGGIIETLRRNFGLDDLDVTTDEAGTTQVRLGKYLSDNLYSDVVVDSNGDTEINLNLDLTPQITVKGGVDTTGKTSLGVFFERDY